MTAAAQPHLTPAVLVKIRHVVPKNHSESRVPKAELDRIHARAVKRIFDTASGELVGWLYEWNTGETVPRWKSKVHSNVYYE